MKRKQNKEALLLHKLLEVITPNQEIQLKDREGNTLTGIETVSFIRKTEKYLLMKPVVNIQVAAEDTYFVITMGKI